MSLIRIRDIPGSDLPPERKIELTARAITELGVAQALVMIHGPEHGVEVYAMHGGCVRFDAEGEPVMDSGGPS